jgi:hypothetical protein
MVLCCCSDVVYLIFQLQILIHFKIQSLLVFILLVIEFIDLFSEVFFFRKFNSIRIEKLMETSEELTNQCG